MSDRVPNKANRQRMRFFHIFMTGLVCLFASQAQAQTAVAPQEKRHRWSVYAGVGPNHYFNNLVKLKSQINEFNYSFVSRVMWEPEHLLSIGFETGYYRLYSMKGPNITIKNSAVPIQLVVGMKFLKSFYFNFSIGRSILINDISGTADDYDATAISLADFGGTLGYKRKLNKRISLGVETKYYFSSKAEDSNLALAFVAGYGFRFK
jgi:Outer membrane protein beta-barrel domain